MEIIKRRPLTSPWLALVSFFFTLLVATFEQWSAEELAWSFWVAGLGLGLIYLTVYQAAQGDRETLLLYPFFLIFFYFIFAGFLDTIFAFATWDATGTAMPTFFAEAPAAIAQAVRSRWPFLLATALSHLPTYILDARTVHFTDLSKPLFAKDLLRMTLLLFLLMPLALMKAGILALYPILFVYFLPWESLRQIMHRLWRLLRS